MMESKCAHPELESCHDVKTGVLPTICANKIPSMESSVIESKKHEESCGIGEQALKSVGEACVKYFSDMSEYVCSTRSTSPCA